MRTITGTIEAVNGIPPENIAVTFTLVDANRNPISTFVAATHERIYGTFTAYTNASGNFAITLWENTLLVDETYYLVNVDFKTDVPFIAGLQDGGSSIDWLEFKAGGVPITPAEFDLIQQKLDELDALNLSRKVGYTANGGTGTEDGDNTWAKLATYRMENSYDTFTATYSLQGITSPYSPAIIFSVRLRNSPSDIYNAYTGIEVISNSSTAAVSNDGFKLVAASDALDTDIELWVKKEQDYHQFNIYELSENSSSITAITYNQNAAWQSTEPTGTVEIYSNWAGAEKLGVKTGLKNKIINGGFNISQRGAQANPTFWSSADRWICRSSTTIGGTSTYQNGHFILGDLGSHYLKIDHVGATSKSGYIIQRIEGLSIHGDLTLSFSQGETGTLTGITCTVKRFYGTGGTPSATDTYVNAVPFNNVGNDYSLSFNIPDMTGKTVGTNYDGYLEIWISYGWTSTDISMRFSQVQLEAGTTVTPFEQRPIGLELGLCQRYYNKFYNYIPLMQRAYSPNNTDGYAVILFPVTMRTTPTILGLTASSGSVAVWSGSTYRTGGFVAVQSGMTGISYLTGWTADAEL